MNKKNAVMTEGRRKICEMNAKIIKYYRRNPCIACEDLLGIQLLDSQKWMLAASWNAKRIVWSCSRNFGKSFLIAIICLLKGILYENQKIYIVSSVGSQAKETFGKIEEIAMNMGSAAASITSLKDIAGKETKKSPNCPDGFKHDPGSFQVSFYNGSTIFTLNAKPDNIRGKRANLVIFDEAAFCSEELIVAVEPFTTQDAEFRTNTNDDYDPDLVPQRVPNQIIYASSQDDMDTVFYQRYKDFAKYMLAGDRNYFVCDMPCDTAITVYMKGKEYKPLLQRSVVDAAVRSNVDKARREYFNVPSADVGGGQIVKWATIRRNEKQIIPYQTWKPENNIVLAFDPARTSDNSILSAMNLYEDPDTGWNGDIVNCINMIDLASRKKYKLDSNRQIEMIHNTLLDYNGDHPDYEYIDSLMVDAGSGGGGVSTYADRLLNNYTDKKGKEHRGLIDKDNELYIGYSKRYPDAVNLLHLIQPRKYRTQMVEEFIELMELGVIHFPLEYGGQEFLKISNGIDEETKEEELDTYYLSQDEIISLTQIDLMKTEITSIIKSSNAENTSVQYALSKEKANRMHDDKFYTIILLAHRLYEKRRGKLIKKKHSDSMSSKLSAFQVRAPKFR